MTDLLHSPAFGQADLTNCERELIHLAGSIQPYGCLLVVSPGLQIIQYSENVERHLGIHGAMLVNRALGVLGGDLADVVHEAASDDLTERPRHVKCWTDTGGRRREHDGSVHRLKTGEIVIELEPVAPDAPVESVDELRDHLADAVQRFSGMLTIAALSDAVAQHFRNLTGYNRVMVYKFDPDGHGEIIAEAREQTLDPLLGHRYPATDIPQRARDLYIRNRVRLLTDVNYEPVPIVPRCLPTTGDELDMSLCHLRSMSPLHLQYLRNMGVTGTLVVSLIREGRLWGLIACHHYSPRHVPQAQRMVAELLAEVISTRIAAIEHYVHAQVDVLVRRLELRLMEATSTDGDWRYALFRNSRTLLQPLDATGAALFWDGEIITTGEVPSTPELQQLVERIGPNVVNATFACNSIERLCPDLSSLTPTASGIFAFQLSPLRPDYLIWFRKERLRTVKWAGDPAKPMIDNDPLHLSPRRSFATWSEIVRGTASPWSHAEEALGRAIGNALVDIILQINAVRLVFAQHQLSQVRTAVENSLEAVIIANEQGQVLFANGAFRRLIHQTDAGIADLEEIAAKFQESLTVRQLLRRLLADGVPCRGEWTLASARRPKVSVSVRADVIPAQHGGALGFILIFTDISDRKHAEDARRRFHAAMSSGGAMTASGEQDTDPFGEPDVVVSSIVSNANVAAMEIADIGDQPHVEPLLEELQGSARRAALIYRQLRDVAKTR
jgi:PAS domain S-box-containing protein